MGRIYILFGVIADTWIKYAPNVAALSARNRCKRAVGSARAVALGSSETGYEALTLAISILTVQQ
tara:strand:- start:8342 stop:8536 length:195 start_codon:yes stop_codon:yes gene_type:complete